MRFLLFSVLFVLLLPAKAQEATDSTMLININESLNFYDFEQVRDYIYKNGDRKTYCPHYTNNPHYKIEDKGIEVYLNPSTADNSIPEKLDYTIVYIVSKGNSIHFNYYLYLTDQRDVYLYDYNKYLSDESLRKQVLANLNSVLTDMKKDMKLLN